MDITSGTQVLIRDEEWLVRSVTATSSDGLRLAVTGTSELVKDQDAIFLTALDDVQALDPSDVRLIPDDSPGFRRSRLWLESVMRQTPVPQVDRRITVGHEAMLDPMSFQLRPAQQAMDNVAPRILIGDAVGLGKTLEIGILVSELIRRGRGERILVVTPRAVLEQFQHEMWTRFSVPLVRLDSDGIQRVRRTLPSSRNPFSYYRRVIVSLDTLKNPARYRHHLEKQRWDIVVIDECHNVITPGTQNNDLARLLARQTEALILASATPHNGKMESFAELVGMLDPTAIADPKDYKAEDIAHLFVRRHRNSPDVKNQVGAHWAAREEPDIRPVQATPEEEAVLAELNATWLNRNTTDDHLFGWTLLKAFLSSPQALTTTIDRRLQRLKDTDPQQTQALGHLRDLTQDAHPSSKSAALIDYLKSIGIAAKSDTRVVIFSERIDTLLWLQTFLKERLKLPAKAIGLLHAQLPDNAVQDVVEQFSLESSPLRILLASDMASEGINLHRQCHHLVHYDLPWSFITIQQRNGRIDRYMQLHRPQIAALALTSADEDISSDLRVVTRLLQKEHAANQALGDAGALLKVRDADIEERTVMTALAQGKDLDDLVPDQPEQGLTFFEQMMLGTTAPTTSAPETAERASLFLDDDNFLWEVLQELGLDATRDEDNDMVAFDTPEDLLVRLRDLPDSYLHDRQVTERIRLSANVAYATARLVKARKEGDTLWPDVHFLGPIHPVLDWAATRTLAQFNRNEAPVMVGTVDEPIVLTQAVWSNAKGQVTLARWGAWSPSQDEIADLLPALDAAGIRENAINPGVDATGLDHLIEPALAAARADIIARRSAMEATLDAQFDGHIEQVALWQEQALEIAEASNARRKNRDRVTQTTESVLALIDSQRVTGDPYVRVLGVIVAGA